MPSRRSNPPASDPGDAPDPGAPENGSSNPDRVAQLEGVVQAMSVDLADTREAVKLMLEKLAGDRASAPGASAPGQTPAAYVQPGPGVPPVALSPYAPAPGAPPGSPQGDISPGMIQLLQLAQQTFGPGSGGSSAIEQRLIEGSLGILDAKLASAKNDALLSELIVKRIAGKLAGSVAEDVSRAFD